MSRNAFCHELIDYKIYTIIGKSVDHPSLVREVAKLHEKLTDTVEMINKCFAVQVVKEHYILCALFEIHILEILWKLLNSFPIRILADNVQCGHQLLVLHYRILQYIPCRRRSIVYINVHNICWISLVHILHNKHIICNEWWEYRRQRGCFYL